MNLASTIRLEESGSPTLVIDNEFAEAEIALFGAHVMAFTPKADGRNRLWLSPLNRYQDKEDIMGGVPVCWPWFATQFPGGDDSLPIHGLVRTRRWEILDSSDTPQGTEILFSCPDTTGPGFDGHAQLHLRVLVGKELEITLTTLNVGNTSFPFTCALHTYFALSDIQQLQIQQVTGRYADKTRDMQLFDAPEDYRITEETDRIHFYNGKSVTLHCDGVDTQITSKGQDSFVIWNPWQENVKNFWNIPDQDYRKFVCVESAITQGIELGPGEIHTLTQVIA